MFTGALNFADLIFRLYFNPFAPNVPCLYLLKTSEKLTAFRCFQGVEKGSIGNKWVKIILKFSKFWCFQLETVRQRKSSSKLEHSSELCRVIFKPYGTVINLYTGRLEFNATSTMSGNEVKISWKTMFLKTLAMWNRLLFLVFLFVENLVQ